MDCHKKWKSALWSDESTFQSDFGNRKHERRKRLPSSYLHVISIMFKRLNLVEYECVSAHGHTGFGEINNDFSACVTTAMFL